MKADIAYKMHKTSFLFFYCNLSTRCNSIFKFNDDFIYKITSKSNSFVLKNIKLEIMTISLLNL
jgi:hypothetical protein